MIKIDDIEITGRGATISECGKYRYHLWREFHMKSQVNGHNPMPLVYIMMNPSTADANKDDRTVQRCMKIAAEFHYSRIEVVNLFAFRATDPQVILKWDELEYGPIGDENDLYINGACCHAGAIICAWGVHSIFQNRNRNVMNAIKDYAGKTFCLALTKNGGHPLHPLYSPSEPHVIPFNRD